MKLSASKTYYDTHLRERLVEENVFRRAKPEDSPVPAFDEAREALPQPFWDAHESAVDCYWKTWELAFENICSPAPESGFIASFVDTAFNDCLFMWDSAFILMFARYGRRAFDFQRTLDNLYAKQHPDGFICREIGTLDGEDRFERHEPASTGPNVLPWTEWEHYLDTSDRGRLSKVFPVLLSYHRWLRRWRTWPDGTYWSCGLGSGMDNQPRFPAQTREERLFHHGHLVWVDACLQQILSADLLSRMAGVLGRAAEVTDLQEEREHLSRVANERLWSEASGFYHDELPGGVLSEVKTIGAYWALLARVVPQERLARFVAHLEDSGAFDRPHLVPSLSADYPEYAESGGYWLGGVWPPTNYMLLRGLERYGYRRLAHEIGRNHTARVTRVFEKTGTLWENYAPEKTEPGEPARDDFVGWSGLGPVAVLFEYVFGLRADAANSRLLWDVRLLEEHGVRRYPLGAEGVLDLSCAARSSEQKEPLVCAESNVPVEILIRWKGGEKKIRLPGS